MQDPQSIRVDRPYATEEAFLEAEAWSVNARSMLLIDVNPIPEGTALRCELRLSNGHALIVAEGYAVKHLDATATRPKGLVVRYKRMSAASTEFVKRAVAHNTESKTASSPSAALAPVATQTRPPAPRAPSVSPPQTPSAHPRARSVRPPQTSSAPPRAPTLSPPRTPSAQPPPRPTRSPSALPSMKPPAPVRKSSKPPSLTPPRRSSVMPSAPRASMVPPSIGPRRSSDPEASQLTSRFSPTSRDVEGPSAVRRTESANADACPSGLPPRGVIERSSTSNPATASVSTATRPHDTDAMLRLRSRIPNPISAPADREAVLSRLKNKPQT